MEFLKSWKEVQTSDEYKKLSPAGKKAAKKQYPFDREKSDGKAKMHTSMVETIEGIGSAIKGLENKIAEISIDAPVVNVPAPIVNVDAPDFEIDITPLDTKKELNKIIHCLEGLEQQVKNIKLEIPKPDNSYLEKIVEQIKNTKSETGEQIDHWSLEWTERDRNGFAKRVDLKAVTKQKLDS